MKQFFGIRPGRRVSVLLMFTCAFTISNCFWNIVDDVEDINPDFLIYALLTENASPTTTRLADSDCTTGYTTITGIAVSNTNDAVTDGRCDWYLFTSTNSTTYTFTLTYEAPSRDVDLRVYDADVIPSSLNYTGSSLSTSPDSVSGLTTASGSFRYVRVLGWSCSTACDYSLLVN